MKKNNWEDLSDESLVEEFSKTNDDSIFKELYKRYNKRIYNYMRKFLYNASSADIQDLTSEVFVNVYIGICKLKKKFSFKKWIYTIAHNICVNYIKATKETMPLVELPDKRIDIEEQTMMNEIRTFVQNEINKIENTTIREAIIMKFYQELSYDEISEILNISVRTLKYKIKEALIRLNKKLKDAGFY